MATLQSYSNWKLHKLQRAFKWVVYLLLFVNFCFYIQEDWSAATYTLGQDAGLAQWFSAFATTIDETAWFILLIMLELETYVLDDEQFTPWVTMLLHAIRVVCFTMIAYPIFAFGQYVIEVRETLPVENVTSLCQLADRDLSYTYNLDYREVTEASCGTLSSDTKFYWVAGDDVVADAEGLRLERRLAWADLAEVVIWLVIIIAIELVVRMHDRGISRGIATTVLTRTKLLGYSLLLSLGVYWAWLGHTLYLWDTMLWIGGFVAIEMNLSEWRDELDESGT
jgi:hypothetical protein